MVVFTDDIMVYGPSFTCLDNLHAEPRIVLARLCDS